MRSPPPPYLAAPDIYVLVLRQWRAEIEARVARYSVPTQPTAAAWRAIR